MLIVTTETINGKNLEMLGTVKGSTIQTVNAFKDIGSGLKTLVLRQLPEKRSWAVLRRKTRRPQEISLPERLREQNETSY